MLSLLCFELIFHPLESLLAPRVTIFAVQGSPGSAKETHEDPGLDFHRFLVDDGKHREVIEVVREKA